VFGLVENGLARIMEAGRVEGCIVEKRAPFPGLFQALAARGRVPRMAARCAAVVYLDLTVV
jgi:hypothetical protein